MATSVEILQHSHSNGNRNKLGAPDRAAHDWYRFVLSYPPHLVRHYLNEFGVSTNGVVLDPFCGTGTTPVECKKQGIRSIGIEAHPMASFASQVKTDWSPDPDEFLSQAEAIDRRSRARLLKMGVDDEEDSVPKHVVLQQLDPEAAQLLLTDSISPMPLHKTLVLLESIAAAKSQFYRGHYELALAKALVTNISNLHFGPEVGVGKPKVNVPVLSNWLSEVRQIAVDLKELGPFDDAASAIHNLDSREDLSSRIQPHSIDAVITSPPYPNEKDYTRTTRLESVMLGFLRDRRHLRSLKAGLVRSNTRGVYVTDSDDRLVEKFASVQAIAKQIEDRRIELGKTSGFERMYPRVTKLYFGGMARHFESIKQLLKPGARLAYVVGDQASYLRVLIRTGSLLAEIADDAGFRVLSLDLFRTRLATATRAQLREEVLVLEWRGKRSRG